MPWTEGQYCYAPGAIRALIVGYEELRTAVYDRGDPDTEAAAMVWDLERALEGAGLSRRQRLVLSLLRQGLEPFHIAAVLGISASSVYTHMARLQKKIRNFLNGCRVDTL